MPPSNARKLLDDCFLHDTDRLRHDEALTLLRDRLAPLADIESVSLASASGRIAAAPLVASHNIPDHDNSAVDGYAFLSASMQSDATTYAIGTRIPAGTKQKASLRPGEAARIFTGAVMPDGADTVAMQEDCLVSEDGNFVTIPAGLKPGANRRKAGEDVARGSLLFGPGTRLRPQEIAAAASAGFASINVFKPLDVAVISSGDELVAPGKPLRSGQVHDSNRFLLQSLLAPLGITIHDFGIIADSADATRVALEKAAKSCQVIITTGGASRGEEDHMITTLDALGKRHLWQLAVKPGRPMCFGQIGDTLYFGLPGNPVAAFVCFLLYVRPALVRLGGGEWPEPQRYPVPAGFSVPRKKPDRREFWRGWIEMNAYGDAVAQKFERDGSGLISGLRQATGLIEITEETTAVTQGDLVSFIPFAEFGIL
ncbi:MAG: molybdopterin molybdotransferase MoeA [Nitratireductor sp.]|nr:molybdopterin molybdotransferase MoeA [Nitratireductor sp.]